MRSEHNTLLDAPRFEEIPEREFLTPYEGEGGVVLKFPVANVQYMSGTAKFTDALARLLVYFFRPFFFFSSRGVMPGRSAQST